MVWGYKQCPHLFFLHVHCISWCANYHLFVLIWLKQNDAEQEANYKLVKMIKSINKRSRSARNNECLCVYVCAHFKNAANQQSFFGRVHAAESQSFKCSSFITLKHAKCSRNIRDPKLNAVWGLVCARKWQHWLKINLKFEMCMCFLVVCRFVSIICGCVCEENIQKSKMSSVRKRNYNYGSAKRVIRFLFLVTCKVKIL